VFHNFKLVISLKSLNATIIVLILKKFGVNLKDFLPIILVSGVYDFLLKS
jgi:hypothetical protein